MNSNIFFFLSSVVGLSVTTTKEGLLDEALINPHDPSSSVNLIPLVQVLFDWLENYTLGFLAQQYLVDGTISSSIADLASAFCMIKWAFSGLTYALILVGVILLIYRFFKVK